MNICSFSKIENANHMVKKVFFYLFTNHPELIIEINYIINAGERSFLNRIKNIK
jgi:hypothetical protein